ncbi:MAG: hypothetical protein EOP56_15830 [Sphingobacteriales bacterium]|nr:MAG: hypothetical protein EOP56_15830 [Sphingobacteriales bacterium]
MDKETLRKWHEDPANWKGSIYHNPSDPRMLPPKKTKAMGWTINTANKRSVIGFLIAIGFTLITTAVIIIVEVI